MVILPNNTTNLKELLIIENGYSSAANCDGVSVSSFEAGLCFSKPNSDERGHILNARQGVIAQTLAPLNIERLHRYLPETKVLYNKNSTADPDTRHLIFPKCDTSYVREFVEKGYPEDTSEGKQFLHQTSSFKGQRESSGHPIKKRAHVFNDLVKEETWKGKY